MFALSVIATSRKTHKSIRTIRLAVFASGVGSTLRAVHQAIRDGRLRGLEIVLLVSNNSASGAMAYAKSQGIAVRHISLTRCGSEDELCRTLLQALEESQAEYILLAGYMKRVPDVVLARFQNRIINVHPALLPAFGGTAMYGDRVHAAVLERGCKVSGATVHFVDSEYDAGPIIAQECCSVLPDDTVESLKERVQKLEVSLLIATLKSISENELRIVNNRIIVE